MDSFFRAAEAERSVETHAAQAGQDLALRVYTARLLGEDPSLVLHDGGSASVKGRAADLYGDVFETIHISGHGERLATIALEGFASCRLAPLRKLAERAGTTEAELIAELDASRLLPNKPRGARVSAPFPSLDALVHAVLPGRFVDHAHADAALAVLNQPDVADVVDHIFGQHAIFVPYAPHGAALAKRVAEGLRARAGGQKPLIVVVDKHGLYTWGDTAQESYEAIVGAVTLIEQYIDETRIVSSRPTISAPDPELYSKLAPILRGALMRASGQPWIASWRASAPMRAFCDRIDMTILAQFGCASPEHAAAMRPKPLVLGEIDATSTSIFRKRITDALGDYASAYEEYIRRASSGRKVPRRELDPWPRVLLFEGLGALCVGRSAAEAEEVADIYEHTTAIIDAAHAMQGFKPASEVDVLEGERGRETRARLSVLCGPDEPPPLDRKIALVTGAAAGIGLATARALLKAGAHVVLTDRNEAALEEAAQALATWHPKRVERVACDVTAEAQVRRAMGHACTRFGGIDVVVSNAGGAFPGALSSSAGKDALRASLELNLLGHQNVARAAADVLLLQGTGGVLLFTAAGSALQPSADTGPYAVAEAALLALMRQYAIELGPHGVRANAVSPGRVRTDLYTAGTLEARARTRGLSVEEYFRANLLGRETLVDDVAGAFVHLSTAAATTGCVLTVDGGLAPAFPR